MERRLAAIMAADVVGYSRLMEADEAATLATLKARRRDVLDPLVAKHRGRVFKVTGDGVLVEFGSAVNAVQCAVDLQQAMAAANGDQPVGQHIVLRIGVNLGDVMVEGSDLYGDGVNVAARLEAIAEPGSILLSGTAHEYVRNKVKVGFDDLGVQNLKNIAQPVHAYRVSSTPAVAIASPTTTVERPFIAVLPFTNMSGDPEQEYFSDGITEDIITELSRFRSLLVIARASTFAYKGKSPRVQEVGRELGVQWVVEGSIRKVGNRVRVTAQLIDAITGTHVWAERYDRTLNDIFEVQDEVVRAIAGAIPGMLNRISTDRARRKPPANLTAFDHLLKGRRALWNGPDIAAALEYLGQAIEADSDYALAHALIAFAHCYSQYFLGRDPAVANRLATEHATLAVTLDDSDSETLYATAIAYIMSGNRELADLHSKRAIENNPSDPFALQIRGLILTYLGSHSEAMEYFAQSDTLFPRTADDWRYEHLCDCLYMMGRLEEFSSICRTWPSMPIHMKLEQAAAHALLGNMDESRAAMQAFNESNVAKPEPGTFARAHVRMCARPEDRDRWIEGYRKAGLSV